MRSVQSVSYLSLELERLLNVRGWSQQALADAARVHPSIITRTMRGQSSISDENFRRLVVCLTSDPVAQAQCLVARLCDLKRGPASELVEIRLRELPALRETPDRRATVQVMLERAETHLRDLARSDPQVRELIIDLARCLRLDYGDHPDIQY